MRHLFTIILLLFAGIEMHAQCNIAVPPNTTKYPWPNSHTRSNDTAFFCSGISVNVEGKRNLIMSDPYTNIELNGDSNLFYLREGVVIEINGNSNTIYKASNVSITDNGSNNQIMSCPNDEVIFDKTNAPPYMCNYTGINKSASNSEINIYPNPSNGIFSVDLRNHSAADIRIFNTVGKLVYSELIMGGEIQEIEVEMKGLYHLQIISDDIILEKKILVQ